MWHSTGVLGWTPRVFQDTRYTAVHWKPLPGETILYQFERTQRHTWDTGGQDRRTLGTLGILGTQRDREGHWKPLPRDTYCGPGAQWLVLLLKLCLGGTLWKSNILYQLDLFALFSFLAPHAIYFLCRGVIYVSPQVCRPWGLWSVFHLVWTNCQVLLVLFIMQKVLSCVIFLRFLSYLGKNSFLKQETKLNIYYE